MNNPTGISAASILAGLFILFNFLGLDDISTLKGASFVMMFYGLITIITSLQTVKRSSLVLAAGILSLGIILYVLDNFEILNWYDLVLPSALFTLSACLLVLYLENVNEFVFLASGIFIFLLSIASVLFFRTGVVQLANTITLILFDYWSLILILFGVLMLASKPGKKLSSPLGSGGNTINITE